jgi:hypothetical protein
LKLEKRFRHSRGYGVHSPFLYKVVREAMMPRKVATTDTRLRGELVAVGVGGRTAVRLQNLYTLEGYGAWRIDSPAAEGELAIATPHATDQEVVAMATACAKAEGSTLAILHPIGGSKMRRTLCRRLIAKHPSMSASKLSLTLLFKRADLHKQHIVI